MDILLLALAVLVADQASKAYIVSRFAPGESLPVLRDVFHITYVENSGAAFGLLAGQRWLFLAVALLSLALLWQQRRLFLEGDRWRRLGAGLFLGGALGNVLDRLRLGLVIDFLDLRFWPVFNIADTAICLGIGAIIWSLYQQEYRERKAKKNS